MTITEDMNTKHEEDLQKLKEFRLLDDEFMTKVFEGYPECIELVLQIVMEKPDLKVLDVRTQVFVENLLNRSVRLDVLATDITKAKYNIEVQRTDKGASFKRARYNSSMMDAGLLKKGADFDSLEETYVIFITENDVIGRGEALYLVGRCFLNSGELFEDGSHIIYVNGSYRDDSPIGKLMYDFSCTRPKDMNYKLLADRARFFKEEKEGVLIMSKIMDELREQTAKEKAIQIAKDLIDRNVSFEVIAECCQLTLEEVKALVPHTV